MRKRWIHNPELVTVTEAVEFSQAQGMYRSRKWFWKQWKDGKLIPVQAKGVKKWYLVSDITALIGVPMPSEPQGFSS